jgi:hypothetical protein
MEIVMLLRQGFLIGKLEFTKARLELAQFGTDHRQKPLSRKAVSDFLLVIGVLGLKTH